MLDTLVTQEGTMTGFAPVTIRNKNLGRVMRMLARQYTRPKDAVIRELLANGLDSHRKAGQTRPVLTSLPTQNRNLLTICDYGTGLDLEQMLGTFCEFAETTKEEDQEAIGFFGIGSKSPLAVADQFTVKSVKDGHAYQVLFIVQNGSPERKVVDLGPTDEPNGVMVIVPTRPEELTQWENAARRVLYWQDADSFELAHPLKGLDNFADNLVEEFSTPNVKRMSTGRPTMVRMGGIGYDIQHGMLPNMDCASGLMIQASPKTFELTPAREAIEDTAENRRKLAEAITRWNKVVEIEMEQRFAQATTLAELYVILNQAPEYLHYSNDVLERYKQRMEEILPRSTAGTHLHRGLIVPSRSNPEQVSAQSTCYLIQERRVHHRDGLYGYKHENYVSCVPDTKFFGDEFVEILLGKKPEGLVFHHNLFLDRPGAQLTPSEDKILRDWMRLVLARRENSDHTEYRVVVWDTSSPAHRATFDAESRVEQWLDIEQLRAEVKAAHGKEPKSDKPAELRIFTRIERDEQRTRASSIEEIRELAQSRLPVLLTRQQMEELVSSWHRGSSSSTDWGEAFYIVKGSRTTDSVSKLLGGIEIVDVEQAQKILKARRAQKDHECARRQIEQATKVFDELDETQKAAAVDGQAMTGQHRVNLRRVLQNDADEKVRVRLEPMLRAAQSPKEHRDAVKVLSAHGQLPTSGIALVQDSMPLCWELLKKACPSPELLTAVLNLDRRG